MASSAARLPWTSATSNTRMNPPCPDSRALSAPGQGERDFFDKERPADYTDRVKRHSLTVSLESDGSDRHTVHPWNATELLSQIPGIRGPSCHSRDNQRAVGEGHVQAIEARVRLAGRLGGAQNIGRARG